MTPTCSRLRRPSSEAGFTMVVVMFALLVGTIVSIAAWTAARGDIKPTTESIDDKRAYAAAEAGLADYLQKLGGDNEYWLKCTNVPALQDGTPAPVNQQWSGTGADPRVWRAMPVTPPSYYTLELLPRSPYTACQPNVDASMLDSSGTIRVRSTGRSGIGKYQRKRSINATLRRNGFLDFLYFTEYETSDPSQKELDTQGYPTKPCAPAVNCAQQPIATWADSTSTCQKTVADGRNSVSYPGSIYYSGRWNDGSSIGCGSIDFLGTDTVQGPFHTNDTLSLCGSPKFGRNRTGNTSAPVDRVEFYGYQRSSSSCGTSVPDTGNNKVISGSALSILKLPQSNTQLLQTAQTGGIVYSGQTTIVLNGTTMNVTTGGTTYNNVALPGNGVIYVTNSATGTCPSWSVRYPYAAGQSACGDVIVRGTYGASLTIAAARDVRIGGNLIGSNNSLLGLIANNFVRVEHPVASYPCDSSTADSTSGDQSRTIEAAILSLGHVFTVDNYQCGNPLGTLTVKGAIAQRYRGPVGTHSGGTIQTGYAKAYSYDDRLKYRSPPYFLAPVQSAWRVIRSVEQVPPT